MSKMCYNAIKVGGRMKRLLVITSAILALVLGIGVSYSMWIMTNSQDNVNAIETTNKCFNVELISESNNIKLENAYPITDEAGRKLNPYSFKITNTCEWNAYYKVNLETLSSSTIDNKFIKASIDNSNSQVINKYTETETSLKDSKSANTLKSGYLPVGGSVSFDLRLWMDYETTIADIKNDGTDKWSGKIVVVSSLVEDKEILAACQNKGGDLIDEGECRKYYVKLNQLFDLDSVFVEVYNYEVTDKLNNTFHITSNDSRQRFAPLTNYNVNDLYYYHFLSDIDSYFSAAYRLQIDDYPQKASKYSKVNALLCYYFNFTAGFNSYILIPNKNDWSMWYYEENNDITFSDYGVVNLTLMFGDGNEPDKEWCDKYLTNYLEYNSEGTMTPIREIGEPIKTAYYDVISLVN